MPNEAKVYQQDLIKEIKSIPPEYFPNLLQMIRIFRETAFFNSLSQKKTSIKQNRYPLRGLPFKYFEPMEAVAIDDWETLLDRT
ncbi:MAG: hypothetical protein HQM10_05945 [Candidatus Riflebacteria bacterium]|nr:hypothetical protein [Candidatus Riflebacteria bacterium]